MTATGITIPEPITVEYTVATNGSIRSVNLRIMMMDTAKVSIANRMYTVPIETFNPSDFPTTKNMPRIATMDPAIMRPVMASFKNTDANKAIVIGARDRISEAVVALTVSSPVKKSCLIEQRSDKAQRNEQQVIPRIQVLQLFGAPCISDKK